MTIAIFQLAGADPVLIDVDEKASDQIQKDFMMYISTGSPAGLQFSDREDSLWLIPFKNLFAIQIGEAIADEEDEGDEWVAVPTLGRVD